MKRIDLIIGILVSAGIHGGVLWGGELFNPKAKRIVQEQQESQLAAVPLDFTVKEEEPVKEDPTDAKDTTDTSDSSDSGDSSAASLPEPMNTIGVSSITTVIKPSPPIPPSKDSVAWSPPSKSTRTLNTDKFKEFVDFNKLDQKPVGRSQRAPQYPFELKRQGIAGQCTVQFFVDDKGEVSDPVVISSSHREFEKPCLEVVVQWRFSPGKKNGRAVATRMQQQFPFTLNR
jgi:protein TonB